MLAEYLAAGYCADDANGVSDCSSLARWGGENEMRLKDRKLPQSFTNSANAGTASGKVHDDASASRQKFVRICRNIHFHAADLDILPHPACEQRECTVVCTLVTVKPACRIQQAPLVPTPLNLILSTGRINMLGPAIDRTVLDGSDRPEPIHDTLRLKREQ